MRNKMAEMTAAEVVAWLTDDKAFGQECYSRKQIAQLIEQQQQQIERLKCCGNCKNQCVNDKCYASKTTDMNHLVWVDACRLHKCDKWQGVE